MSRHPVVLAFRVVSFLIASAFTVTILELVGMSFYLALTDQNAAFDRLASAGIAPGLWVEFLLASPERLAVAVGLAVVGLLMVTFNQRHRHDQIRLELGD